MPCVSHLTGLSRSTIYRLIEKNDFPKPIPLGSKSIGFLSSEVEAWKEQRITSSRKAKGVQL
jgi:prophage regulatory protein